MTTVSADLAFSFGLFCGFLALVVWVVWPDHRCHDEKCDQYQREHKLGKYKPPPEPPTGWYGDKDRRGW